MNQPHAGIIYNQVKAGLVSAADDIAAKVADASKDTRYFQLQKERSKNCDAQISKMQEKIRSMSAAELDFATYQVDNFIKGLESKRSFSTIYMHCDLDSFFASVEALLDPSLKGTAFAVGGSIKHGIISTSSYEARKYGVRSGMAVFVAMRLCPHLNVVRHHGDKYMEYSHEVQEIFKKYDPNFVSFGCDEATLDITHLINEQTKPDQIAKQVQQEVFEKTKLTISCGVAHTPQLSKIASDINKPNGYFIVPNNEEQLKQFLSSLPVRKIPGIGGVNEQLLKGIGIETIGQIIEKRAEIWASMTHKFCTFMFSAAVGVQIREYEAGPQQSISKDRTFDATDAKHELMDMVELLASKVAKKMQKMNIACRNISVKFKDINFKVTQKSYTFDYDTSSTSEIVNVALKLLLEERNERSIKLRLVGVRASNLTAPGEKRQVSIKNFLKDKDEAETKEPKEKPEKKQKKEKKDLKYFFENMPQNPDPPKKQIKMAIHTSKPKRIKKDSSPKSKPQKVMIMWNQ